MIRIGPARGGALVVLVLLASMAAPARAADGPPVKDVAAPAADVLAGRVHLPEPAALARASSLAARPIAWTLEDGRAVARLELAAAAGAPRSVVVATPRAGLLALELVDAGGARPAAAAPDANLRWLRAPSGTPVPELTWTPGTTGPVTLRASGPRELLADRGAWIVRDGSGARLATHLASHERLAGRPLEFVVALTGAGGDPWPGDGARGEVTVTTRDGAFTLPLALRAGRARARIPPLPAGPVALDVLVRARSATGAPLLRSTRHATTLLEPALALTGRVDATSLDRVRVALRLGSEPTGAAARAVVAAEVWGTRPDGSSAPAAWLARVDDTGDGSLTLVLDRRWLALEGLAPPLSLRAVRVHDADTFGLVARLGRAAVPAGPFGAPLPATVPPVSGTMLTGPQPALPPFDASGATAPGPQVAEPVRSLMLVHGYCSDGTTWPLADFSGTLVPFFDPGANRSNDEFAQLMVEQAEAAGVDTFGVVGHSQGGNAALHLLTFYWSGLDAAKGPRRIQALASPWSGTPLAGSLADLGEVFGAGCGSNDDLSEDGAPLWLATIPSWARAEVTYWTTANAASACNALTSFFLQDPEDGVVEDVHGQLPGGNDEGLTLGWCHTTGMSEPPAYTDAARNAEMDALAAR